MSIVDDVNEIRLRGSKRVTWEKTAQILGYSSGEALRSAYRRVNDEKKERIDDDDCQQEEATLVFQDKKEVDDIDWREYLDHAVAGSDLAKRIDDTQRHASIKISTKKPIGVVFTGDWHLGDGQTDHLLWKEDIQTLLDNPNLYVVDLGDSKQNMRTFKMLSVVLDQVLSPKMQGYMVKSIVDELTDKNKLLAKVDGNHDADFDSRAFGEVVQAYLIKRMKAPRFPGKGILTLLIGDIKYTAVLYHKTRFRSIFRPAHGSYREYQFTFPADVVAGAHDHLPAFELLPSYQSGPEIGASLGGYTYLLKVGTYQDSNYGWKYFHNGGRPMNITLVFHPDKKKIDPFFSMEDALRYLKTFDTI